jgi:hypothetical protein
VFPLAISATRKAKILTLDGRSYVGIEAFAIVCKASCQTKLGIYAFGNGGTYWSPTLSGDRP